MPCSDQVVNWLMSLFRSTSKHGQVVYQGPERDFKEVTKSLDSIGPEVIQTLSVSTIHSLLHSRYKVVRDNDVYLLGFLLVNVLQLDEPIRANKFALGRVTRFPALSIDCMFPCVWNQLHVFPRCYRLHAFYNLIF